MNRVRQIAIFVLAMTISVTALGDPTAPTSASLRKLLADPFPMEPAQTPDSLFSRAATDNAFSDSVSQLVTQDPQLSALAREGHVFVTTYQELLKSAFGAEVVGFALSPEAEILRQLRASEHTRNQSNRENTRTELEARNLSLAETAQRFGLGQLTSSQIEQLRHHQSDGEQIYQYYMSRFRRYLITPVDRPRPNDDSVRAFKRRMIAILEQLKARNLESFLSQSLQVGEFSINLGGPKGEIEIRSQDVEKIQVQIEPISTPAPDQVRKTRLKRLSWSALAKWYGSSWKKKDFASARNFYQPEAIYAQTEPRHVRVAFRNRQQFGDYVFDFDEKNVGELINTLKPETQFGDEKNNLIVRRFLIESASRNAIFTNAIAFLEESEDQSTAILEYRLTQRLATLNGQAGKSLSETLQTKDRQWRYESPISDVMWMGYGVHPDYWRVRQDEQVQNIEKWGTKKGVDQTKPLDDPANPRSVRKYARRLETQQRLRMSTEFEQAEARGKIWARRVAMAGALAGAIWLGNHWYQQSDFKPFEWTIQLNVNLSDDGAIKQALRRAWDSLFSQSENSATESQEKPWFKINKEFTYDSFSTSDFDDPNNFKIDSDEDKASAKSHHHDFGWKLPYEINKTDADAIFYLVPQKITYESLPHVYDVVRTKNFTADILRSRGFNSSSRDAIELQLKSATDEADFTVITAIPHAAKAGHVPVTVPNGAEIESIEVKSMSGQILRQGQDYKVFRLRTNHLLWLDLAPEFLNQKIGYKAGYNLSRQVTAKSSAMIDLDSSAVQAVNNELQAAGITTLSGELKSTVSAYSAFVPVTAIEQTFVAGATYTYSSKIWAVRTDVPNSNPFRESSKFVDQSGNLFYQCSGSNDLLKKYLNEVYRFSYLSQFRADNLTAYVVTNDRPVVTLRGGHYRTVIQNINGDGDYKILDATPGGRPLGKPQFKINQPKPINTKGTPISSNDLASKQWWLRPRSPKTEHLASEEVEETNIQPEPEVEEKFIAPSDDEFQHQLALRLRELRELKRRFHRHLSQTAGQDPWFRKNVGQVSAPGLVVNAISRLVDEYVTAKITQDEFLTKIVAYTHRFPMDKWSEESALKKAAAEVSQMEAEGRDLNQIIEFQMELILTSVKRQTLHVEGQQGQVTDGKWDFVLDNEYQALLKRMATLIQHSKWGVLKSHYYHLLDDCELQLESNQRSR